MGNQTYTQEQLQQAFDEIKPKKHWKDRISKTLLVKDAAHQEVLTQACIHFTGSIPQFTQTNGGKTLVTAAGYWATIGA